MLKVPWLRIGTFVHLRLTYSSQRRRFEFAGRSNPRERHTDSKRSWTVAGKKNMLCTDTFTEQGKGPAAGWEWRCHSPKHHLHKVIQKARLKIPCLQATGGRSLNDVLCSEEAEASIKPWESHPEPTTTYQKNFLTQLSWAVAHSLGCLEQPNPGTAMSGFCPSAAAAVPAVSNGQDWAPAEPQTQATPHSKGSPAPGHGTKLGNLGPTIRSASMRWKRC